MVTLASLYAYKNTLLKQRFIGQKSKKRNFYPRESANENEALRSIQSKTKAAEKCLEQLCLNYQAEIEELKEEISDQNCKSRGETKQQLKDRLQLALSERDELKGKDTISKWEYLF